MTLWAGFAKKHRELMFASPQELVRIPTRAGRLGGSSLEQRLWAGHVLRGPKAPQLASTQPGSALREGRTLGHGDHLCRLWKSSRLTLPQRVEGGKERTTPGQSLMGMDAKVLNQLVANGNGTERDWG